MTATASLRRIAACTDGTEVSAAPVEQAIALARATGSRLVFLRAWDKPYAELPPDWAGEVDTSVHDEVAARWGGPAGEAGVDWDVATVEGDVGELAGLVRDQSPDLVVAGYRGGGGFPGLHLGGTAHHLVRTVGRPLMLVPAGSGPALGTVVVGVDGSEHAARTGAVAGALAAATGARVVAVTAYEPVVELRVESDPKSLWSRVESDLAGPWTAPVREAGAEVETEVVRDLHPVGALARVAEDVDAGVVVVGRHGRGTWAGSRVGHTALGVLDALSHRAVCVVP